MLTFDALSTVADYSDSDGRRIYEALPAVADYSESDRRYVYETLSGPKTTWAAARVPAEAKKVKEGAEEDKGKKVSRVEIVRTVMEEWTMGEVLARFSADKNPRRDADTTRQGGAKLVPILLTDKVLHRPLEILTDGEQWGQTAGSQRAEAFRILSNSKPEFVAKHFATVPIIVRTVTAENFATALDQLASDQDQQPFPAEGVWLRFTRRVRAGEKLASICSSMLPELNRVFGGPLLRSAVNATTPAVRDSNIAKWASTGVGPQLYRTAAELPRVGYWLYCQLAAEEGRSPKPALKLEYNVFTSTKGLPEGSATLAALAKAGQWDDFARQVKERIDPTPSSQPVLLSAEKHKALSVSTDPADRIAYALTTSPADTLDEEQKLKVANEKQEYRQLIAAAEELNKQIGYKEWAGLPARIAQFVVDVGAARAEFSEVAAQRAELETKYAELTEQIAAGRRRK